MTTGLRILVAAVMVVLIGALMVGYMFVAFLLPNVWQTADRAFLRRRLGEDCPWWPVGVPVVFAFLVVGLIAWRHGFSDPTIHMEKNWEPPP